LELCTFPDFLLSFSGSFKELSFSGAYTALYNLVDFPAGVVPVTHVIPTDKYNGVGKGMFEAKARSYYDPVESAGMPVGVQVVGLPFRDEIVLRCMKYIQDLTHFPATIPNFSYQH